MAQQAHVKAGVAHLQGPAPNHENQEWCLTFNTTPSWQTEDTLIQEREEGLSATPLVPCPRQLTPRHSSFHSTVPLALGWSIRASCLTKNFCL